MNTLKLTATQNVIRNKFKKAHSIRLKHEHNVNSAMKFLTVSPLSSSSSLTSTKSIDLESENSDFASRNLLKTTNNTPRLNLPARSYSNRVIKSIPFKINKKHHDLSTLCANLRILLSSSSSLHTGDMKYMQQISTILDELRELNIII